MSPVIQPDSQSHLLDDDAVRQFLIDGSIQVRADFADDFHGRVYRGLEQQLASSNPGNNILPRLPELSAVYEHPAVRGALTSLLGPGYFMHPHRYCHLNLPGSDQQHWHKDDYIFDWNLRHHRFRWVMAFYYPQDVTDDMGPTTTMPGRQHINSISDPDPHKAVEDVCLHSGPAGTVTIVNFDSWHRKAANQSDRKRYMLKFQFVRMREPSAPAWNCRELDWSSSASTPLQRSVWNWLAGGSAAADTAPVADELDRARLFRDLEEHEEEEHRLNAAYEVAALGASGVPELVEVLRRQVATAAVEPSPANPQGANPADVSALHALCAVGPEVVPAVIDLLATDSDTLARCAAAAVLGNLGPAAADGVEPLSAAMANADAIVRRNAAEALGTIGVCTDKAAGSLIRAVADKDQRVRLNALLAIARLAAAPTEDETTCTTLEDSVPAISTALSDPDRYVRFYAELALQHIATTQAHTTLIDHLQTSRWCPLTTSDSPY